MYFVFERYTLSRNKSRENIILLFASKFYKAIPFDLNISSRGCGGNAESCL
jgi:hypothetical protein